MLKRTIALVVLAGAIARADVYEYPTGETKYPTLQEIYAGCDLSVGVFMNQNMTPRKECAYSLANVFVFQKVQGGYLLADAEEGTNVVFLKTKAALERNERFDGQRVQAAGTYQYQALDGFAKEVWAFEAAK